MQPSGCRGTIRRMTRAKALLVPNPHGVELGVPTGVELDAAGAAPDRLQYDGNSYRLSAGRGPEGEWLYELFE